MGSAIVVLALGSGCAGDDELSNGTNSGGLGPCQYDCELDADCPEHMACFEYGGDACGTHCLAVECTRDDHCNGGVCSFSEEAHEYLCLPASCAGATKVGYTLLDAPASVAALTDVRCVHGTLDTASLASLQGLEMLERVTGSTSIRNNPALSSLAGLEGLRETAALELEDNSALADLDALQAGLETGSVYIEGNSELPSMQIASLLDRIVVKPYGQVLTCGNLDDDPCDPGT
jgi:hypothetical protein